MVPLEGLPGHLLVRVAQARVVEAHAGSQPAEQLGVRHRLAEGAIAGRLRLT